MTTIEELERRVRTVEEELTGERHVSRYQVEQAVRNSEVLLAIRSEIGSARLDLSALTLRVDALGGDMASVKAALTMHGRALDVLQQDVRQLRQDAAESRRGQEELHALIDAVEQNMNARFNAVEQNMNERFDAVLAAIRAIGSTP